MSLSELSNDFSQYRKSFLSDNTQTKTQKKTQNTKILPLDIDLIYLFFWINTNSKCKLFIEM